MKSFIGYIPQ